MLKTILKRALLGFLIGMAMGDGIAVISSLFSGGSFMPVAQSLVQKTGGIGEALLVQTLLSGVYGSIAFGSISLYDIEKLPLALTSVLHCMIIVLLHIPNALFLGWEETLADVLIMAGIQIASYFIVWLILYFSYRKQVSELNDLQKQMDDSELKAPEKGLQDKTENSIKEVE